MLENQKKQVLNLPTEVRRHPSEDCTWYVLRAIEPSPVLRGALQEDQRSSRKRPFVDCRGTEFWSLRNLSTLHHLWSSDPPRSVPHEFQEGRLIELKSFPFKSIQPLLQRCRSSFCHALSSAVISFLRKPIFWWLSVFLGVKSRPSFGLLRRLLEC